MSANHLGSRSHEYNNYNDNNYINCRSPGRNASSQRGMIVYHLSTPSVLLLISSRQCSVCLTMIRPTHLLTSLRCRLDVTILAASREMRYLARQWHTTLTARQLQLLHLLRLTTQAVLVQATSPTSLRPQLESRLRSVIAPPQMQILNKYMWSCFMS